MQTFANFSKEMEACIHYQDGVITRQVFEQYLLRLHI
jgi:hypothetical protein